MKTFEAKAQRYYGEVAIDKGLLAKIGFGARSIPVYVGEWIVSQFLENGQVTEDGRKEIGRIVGEYFPQKSDKNIILNRLRNGEEVRILDDFRVNVNLGTNSLELSIPMLDQSQAMIQRDTIDENPLLLKTGMWGLGTLRYVEPDGKDVKKGQVWMIDFKPFQTPGVEIDYFTECRQHFELEEWIDLLVSSCQFNPEILNLPQKLILLSRIIPLVQPRVNMTELAPKGTGKSFVFDNISRYAAVIPGGKLSAAALFMNSSTKQLGLIPRFDVVVIDEIQKIHTDTAGEAMAGLKMYLESGRYRRTTGDIGSAEAGFVMLGNIRLGEDRRPVFENEGILSELPSALRESAFIDRVHGMIEGWHMARISRNTPSKSIGFKGDFFSEILHELRSQMSFADYVSGQLHLPDCEDMRDNKAIARLAEGFLKLLFPDLKVTKSEFIEFCVNPALRMRQQVRDELSKLDPEYKWITLRSESPDEFQETHPKEKPEAKNEKEPSQAEPLHPDREPSEGTVHIDEGQRGISYRKLFRPFLKGSTNVKLVDPYIRLGHQFQNLVAFCEVLAPESGLIKLELITKAESQEHEVELSEKFDTLAESLSDEGIEFSYSFSSIAHDRWIESGSGWKILLSRGLDIFEKPIGRFNLGLVDQKKKVCREFNATYVRN